MSCKGHKLLSSALVALCLGLLVALVLSRVQLSNMRWSVQRAHDIIWSMEEDRDMAVKADVTNAVEILWYRLYSPALLGQPSLKQFDAVIERARSRAIRDVVLHLRTKTGDDLGKDPEEWIQEYGAEEVKKSLAAVKEMLAESGDAASNQTVQRTGASRSLQDTNRTSSAAGSRR